MPPIMINATSAALKQVLGFRMLRGRWFTDGERRRFSTKASRDASFRRRDPIGQRIQVSDDGPLLTIVGVVADLKYSQLDPAGGTRGVRSLFSTSGGGLFGITALILHDGRSGALASSLRGAVAARSTRRRFPLM